MRAYTLAIAAALTALLAAGCPPGERDHRPGEARPSMETAEVGVCVSIPPQAWVVERVGGDRVSLEVLVGPGQSPATYEPAPGQIAALDEADVYFRIGVPFEVALMDRIAVSIPDLEIVDLRQGIDLRPISGERADHGHGRKDPHTWLDPDLVAVQAQTVRDTLARIDPDGAETYTRNLEALLDELERLDQQIAAILAPVKGRRMFVFHPAFGYLADAYGLEQIAIEIEGKQPAPRELQHIMEMAREEGLDTIFVQRQFSSAAARAVGAEIGAQVVELDPLARDYAANLRKMARTIRDALQGPGDGR